MGAEFFQWGQLVVAGTQLLVSGVGLAALFLGLVRMKESGARRDREIDEMARAFTQQGAALERQGQVLAELLRRSA